MPCLYRRTTPLMAKFVIQVEQEHGSASMFVSFTTGLELTGVFATMLSNNLSASDQDIEEVFRREYPGLCRYVYRFVRNFDEAADIVQEAFLRYCKLDAVRTGEAADRALLYTLARNRAIDLLRRVETRRRSCHNSFSLAAPKTPEECFLEHERQRIMEAALRSLKPRELECLILRHSGLSYREIAGILALRPNSVGPTIARAVERLRETYASLSRRTTSQGELSWSLGDHPKPAIRDHLKTGQR
jgi:RNA polymerase sigma factor (sigma-70 family)